MLPSISVILPVHNQAKFLEETINSILTQTFRDFELLIIDDGSTDSSQQIIKKFESEDNRIRFYYQENTGRCAATNKIVDLANGRFCALLDADDVMMPDRLEKQLAFHLENPEVDASSCSCYYINEQGNQLGVQRYHFLRTIEECKKARSNNELIQCAITGLFISKKAYTEAGGLNSKFWPCDDFEFFNRLIEKGYILIIREEVLMRYRLHASSVTVKNPLYIYDVIGYVMKCIELRRKGEPEISLKSFLEMRSHDPWWVKLNRRKFNYSQIYFRSAGISLMSKNYLLFCWQIVAALLLSPKYVLDKAINLRQKGVKMNQESGTKE